MIRLKRTTMPQVLQLPEVESMRSSVRGFFQRKEQNRRQERPEFPLFPDRAFGELLDVLLAMSHQKCAYCESAIKHPGNASLDRFRPKAGAVGLNREFSSEHYWWLAYEWENLYAICATCNRLKGPKFPVQGARAQTGAVGAQLDLEDRLLLEPCADDPEKHLEFLPSGEVRPRSSRGDVTIQTLELNRGELVRARLEVVAAVRGVLTSLKVSAVLLETALGWLRDRLLPAEQPSTKPTDLDQLKMLLSPERLFAGTARAEVARWLAERGPTAKAARRSVPAGRISGKAEVTLEPAVSGGTVFGSKAREQQISKKARELSTQTITRIALKNYRGIRELDLQIPLGAASGSPWLILLGENGTGKSSILQAVALTLIDDATDKLLGVTPKEVLRQGEKSGWVKVWIGQATAPRVLEFARGQRRFRREGPPFYPVLLGYGATRLLPRGRRRSPGGRVRLENMFDPFRPLLDADQWLGRLDPRSFDYAARALKDVLSLPASSRLKRVKREGRPGVTLKLFGADLSLEQLSDGYQSVLGLTCDLMSGLKLTGTDALEAAEGLVALDELGAHLHPRWRMRIVTSLRKAFPRVQFLVSTHDPLCLRGLEDNEAAVLRRTERGRIYQVPDLPPLKGLRVDQLLTSEFFGLDSTMDPTVETKFRRLYYLLALRAPTGGQEAEIAKLRAELAPHEIRGSTRREQRLLEILDRELSRVDQEPDPVKRATIRRESEEQITRDLNMLLKPAPAAP